MLDKNRNRCCIPTLRAWIISLCFCSSLCFSEVIDHKIVGYVDFDKKVLYLQSESPGSVLVEIPNAQIDFDKCYDENSNCIMAIIASANCWLKFIPNEAPNAYTDSISITNFEKVKKSVRENGVVGLRVLFFLVNDGQLSGPHILKNKITIRELKSGDLNGTRLLLVPLKDRHDKASDSPN